MKIQLLLKFTIALLITMFASQYVYSQDNSQARKDKILANLELIFPQLKNTTVAIGDISSSKYDGLDMGSFTVVNRNGTQRQNFLLSTDDKEMFMFSGEPLDVSMTPGQIQAEVNRKEQAEARQAAIRMQDLEPLAQGRPVKGNPNGSILIVEFSDFQCSYCRRATSTVDQVLEEYGDEVRFVYKHFPLSFHPWAKPAAIASECVAEQDHTAFWTLHDFYFDQQRALNPSNLMEKTKEFLTDKGLDMNRWSTCAENTSSTQYQTIAKRVDNDFALGNKLGVSGTPGFFINGVFLNGAQPFSAFKPIIEKALK